MHRVRFIVAMLMAVLVCSAVATSSASAGWVIEGAGLSGAAVLATTAKKIENTKLVFAEVTVECSGENLNAVAPQIEAPNIGSVTTLVFSGCSASGKNCKLATSMGGDVGTLPVSLESTVEDSSEVDTKFAPKTGTLLTTLAFEGERCSLAEEIQPVKGTVNARMPTGQEEETLQEIKAQVTSASGELKVGSANASLEGATDLKLASSQKWKLTGAADDTEISMKRIAGNGGKPNVCAFKNKAETCELEVEVVKTGKAAELKITVEGLVNLNKEKLEFKKISPPANTPECTIGLARAATKKCFVKIEYTGPNTPGKGKYKALYGITAEEDGGANPTADAESLEAEES